MPALGAVSARCGGAFGRIGLGCSGCRAHGGKVAFVATAGRPLGWVSRWAWYTLPMVVLLHKSYAVRAGRWTGCARWSEVR